MVVVSSRMAVASTRVLIKFLAPPYYSQHLCLSERFFHTMLKMKQRPIFTSKDPIT